ncbi:unnamed protein product, partial [Ascophyllum nodosum]
MHGETSPFLVVECACLKDRHRARLLLAPVEGIDFPCRSRTFVRSLGYVGSFLREYGSAADLLDSLKKGRRNALLETVCAPGQRASAGYAQRGSFVPSSAVGNLDTSHVPLNETQREAVMRLTGGLDIIVGPPGTGKSTTIHHIIDARVAKGSRVLVTSIRNQAIDAVTPKLAAFGVLVFGNEDRLGKHAREFTVEGRLRNDPELVFWRGVDGAWSKAAARAYDVSWNKLHLPNFPGIERILKTKRRYIQEAKDVKLGKRRRKQLERKSRAAGRWAYVLKWVLRVAYEARLAKGTAAQKRTLRELHALEKCQKLLSIGRHRVRRILCRLEDLTRYRLYTKTRVLISTALTFQVISNTFYKGELKTGEETKLARRSTQPCKWIHVSGGEVRHSGRGFSNALEVREVVKQARAALKRHGTGIDVRVITFYNMQKHELERHFKGKKDISHISISSVDACQGSDADVIIVSTVRSDVGGHGNKLSGFMLDSRRVNVALSRAKEECIVVGDKNTLRSGGGEMWRDIVDHFSS